MAVLATDDFNRANSTGLGANWTAGALSDTLNVNANACVPAVLPGNDCYYAYTGITWPNDHYAQIKVTVTSTGGGGVGGGVAVRRTGDGTTRYRAVVDHAASNNVSLDRFLSGAYQNLALYTSAWTDGDVLRLEAQGSSLRVYRNGTQIGTTFTDANIASGSPGIDYSSSVSALTMDDWEGGDLTGGPTTNTRTATPVTVSLQSTRTRTATPVTVALSLAGQHGFPISDDTVGLWTTQVGGTTNLYQSIDETSPDDADYVQSPAAPNVLTTYAALERQTYGQLEQQDYAQLESTTDYYQARLTSLSTPVSGTRTLRYRYSKDAGAERIDLQVDLYQGATLVQSWTHTDISTTWTQANQSVTGTVTDYTDLHVRLTATQV
jgi:hypothetical protein